jgi:beta-RFAP synthase
MRRVRTASRLHFGLLSLAPEGGTWPDLHGEPLPARRFGGVGLMVERPGLAVRAEPAAAWSAEGPLADRALAFARRLLESYRVEGAGELAPQRLVVEQAAPEHSGLGTGTQLALAVGRLLSSAWGRAAPAAALARRVGRGERSALGIHGFERGGFLVESGQGRAQGLAPLAARVNFPDEWRVVLGRPAQPPGLHGLEEREAFARLGDWPLARTEALCRLVLLGLLPALRECDLAAFGAALFDFNARVGEAFAPAQGGLYAGPRVAELVEFVRRQGVAGVGQSSWGPVVFAVVGDEDRAADLARRVAGHLNGAGEVWVSAACNHGVEAADARQPQGPPPSTPLDRAAPLC